MQLTRRSWLAGIALAACAPARPPAPPPAEEADPFAALEASVGGRVGVFAVDTGSGRALAHRADERFAMCSTFKWALAASVLERVDREELRLDEPVSFAEKDLLDYAPVTRERVSAGHMSVEALAEAIVTVSDNTAANLLLAKVGGPAGVTAYFRKLGDTVTRLDRTEPMLNMNDPGDAKDTTSPRAMVSSLKAVLLGDRLSPGSRTLLTGWMIDSKTGRDRLRAGLPAVWTVGDKTGTGNRGAANDLAVAWPPAREPIVVAAYLSDSEATPERLKAAHAEIGRIVGRELV
jgi:beta-lactamase class A